MRSVCRFCIFRVCFKTGLKIFLRLLFNHPYCK